MVVAGVAGWLNLDLDLGFVLCKALDLDLGYVLHGR
jgi:hypothetical protein